MKNNTSQHILKKIMLYLSCSMFLLTGLLQSQTKIFWTVPEENRIFRMDVDSQAVVALLDSSDGLANPRFMTADRMTQKIYWVNFENNTIQSADWSGSDVEVLLRSFNGVVFPYGVAVDSEDGKIYWTNWDHSVHRANLDGSSAQTILTQNSSNVFVPAGITIDESDGKIYWLSRHNGTLRQANLDGTNPVTLLTASNGLSLPMGLTINHQTGKLYWANEGLNNIQMADRNGTNSVLFRSPADGVAQPKGVYLDNIDGWLYWANGNGKIMRGSTTNNSTETLAILSPEEASFGITVLNFATNSITGNSEALPEKFYLAPNFPNPFNPTTNIRFQMSDVGFVELKVYDLQGREINMLLNENLQPGEYEIQWDGRNYAGSTVVSGVYLLKMEVEGYVQVRKMVLVR